MGFYYSCEVDCDVSEESSSTEEIAEEEESVEEVAETIEAECDTYTVFMWDSHGDGWQDGYFEIDGQTGTLEDGSSGEADVCLASGCYDFFVGEGHDEEE